MWRSLVGLWKARRGRQAAVATIGPLVERSRYRLHGIPEIVWFDPYMIGFMVMLITLVAKREAGIGGSFALSHVQSAAWAAITGLKQELIGEEVLLLSAAHHKSFEFGCSHALAFGQALYGGAMSAAADDWELWESVTKGAPLSSRLGPETLETERCIADLWIDYFDSHVSQLQRFG